MKKSLLTAILAIFFIAAIAQRDSVNVRSTTGTSNSINWKKIDLSNRSNDHFMVQYGFDNWSGAKDSTKSSGFSRFTNVYFMLDKPFKTNPRYSVGIGAGVGSSNMFFERKTVDVKSLGTRLPFTIRDSADHFKKYKLTTVFLEAPVELRYNSNPLNSNKSFKVAIGAKVGTLINAHTKGKTLQNKSGQTINNYIAKESSKKFFNSTKLAATARVGYGIFSLYGAYQVTALLKDNAGPELRPYSIGISISGL
jgi:hypothetical protein